MSNAQRHARDLRQMVLKTRDARINPNKVLLKPVDSVPQIHPGNLDAIAQPLSSPPLYQPYQPPLDNIEPADIDDPTKT